MGAIESRPAPQHRGPARTAANRTPGTPSAIRSLQYPSYASSPFLPSCAPRRTQQEQNASLCVCSCSVIAVVRNVRRCFVRVAALVLRRGEHVRIPAATSYSIVRTSASRTTKDPKTSTTTARVAAAAVATALPLGGSPPKLSPKFAPCSVTVSPARMFALDATAAERGGMRVRTTGVWRHASSASARGRDCGHAGAASVAGERAHTRAHSVSDDRSVECGPAAP